MKKSDRVWLSPDTCDTDFVQWEIFQHRDGSVTAGIMFNEDGGGDTAYLNASWIRSNDPQIQIARVERLLATVQEFADAFLAAHAEAKDDAATEDTQ